MVFGQGLVVQVKDPDSLKVTLYKFQYLLSRVELYGFLKELSCLHEVTEGVARRRFAPSTKKTAAATSFSISKVAFPLLKKSSQNSVSSRWYRPLPGLKSLIRQKVKTVGTSF